MAHHLPPELWMQITQYLENDRPSLAKCARVCRQWQPVFERIIYRNISVESDEIILPYELPNYRSVKLDGYRERNAMRQANDKAFQSGMSTLFGLLAAWEGSKLTLSLEARGRDETFEPETEELEETHSWESERDGRRVVTPYQARFPDGVSVLPEVSSIDHLVFDSYSQRIWGGALLHIAERCVALQELQLDMDDQARGDHVEYMRERRQSLASGLARLPPSLRVFSSTGAADHPWHNTLPALDLRTSNIDDLSKNLRTLSFNLRELKLEYMCLDMDFLCPLDDSGRPTSEISSLHWPYLETITLESVPEHLPCGEWLFDCGLEPGDDLEFPDPTTGDPRYIFTSHWLVEGFPIAREEMKPEYFHRLFISLGYAARRMPLLKTISVLLCPAAPYPTFDFDGTKRGFTGAGLAPIIKFESNLAYSPDERVAAAWGFSLDDMVVETPWPGRLPDMRWISATLFL
ncbi:hypothetical protein BDV12DRAFT_203583 [Aspergillus spectabilis]